MKDSIPVGAECILSAVEIGHALDRMAVAIKDHYIGRELVILTVLNGGMIPTSHLVLRLNIPLTMDYLHASRYHGETGGDQLNWHAHPSTELSGHHVLVVDDILDEGPTLKAILKYCQDQGAASVASAVLVDKKHDRRVDDLQADFVGAEVADRYVFGFGMDYQGGLRHLPDIWALP
jgi:hypoxanthine phosphoribosyltransferase